MALRVRVEGVGGHSDSNESQQVGSFGGAVLSLEASLTPAGLAEYATRLRLLLNRIFNFNLKYFLLAWDKAENIKLISFYL